MEIMCIIEYDFWYYAGKKYGWLRDRKTIN